MEDVLFKFNQSLERLNSGLALNILRLQFQAMETSLKKHSPDAYKDYITTFNELMATDEGYLSLVNSLKEAQDTIELLAASTMQQGES